MANVGPSLHLEYQKLYQKLYQNWYLKWTNVRNVTMVVNRWHMPPTDHFLCLEMTLLVPPSLREPYGGGQKPHTAIPDQVGSGCVHPQIMYIIST